MNVFWETIIKELKKDAFLMKLLLRFGMSYKEYFLF